MLRVHYSPNLEAFKKQAEDEVVGQPATEDDRRFWSSVLAVQNSGADALTRGRDAASKWQTALTAIITLVGISAFLGGRDALSKMDERWARGLAAGVIVILVFAALATWTAQKAVTGSAINDQSDRQAGLGAYRAGPAHEVGILRRRLRVAAQLTLVAFSVGLVVVGLWLTAPSAKTPPTSPKVDVAFDDGSSHSCATVLTPEDRATISLQLANGTLVQQPANQLVAMKPASC